jgi:hypothetical protein
LPLLVRQKQAEVIVVDYDCPEGTADYVREHYPQVQVVAVSGKPLFNTSHARNLGAARALGKFLVFLDADVLIADNFINHLDDNLKGHSFGLFSANVTSSLRGSCAVWREDFERVGGYDELLGGYNGEDLELYMRLRLIKSKEIELPSALVTQVIDQTLAERERYREPDIRLQFLRGQLYLSAKEMVMSLEETPVLDLDYRRALLAQVNRQLPALYSGEQEFLLEINLPDKYQRGFLNDWEFSRVIAVKARRRPA